MRNKQFHDELPAAEWFTDRGYDAKQTVRSGEQPIQWSNATLLGSSGIRERR